MQTGFEPWLLVVLAATLLSGAARRLPFPPPITLVLGGLALSSLPGFPRVVLDPGLFFACFLPPLLFADGWLMPLREFARARRAILLLAVGLVLFTTLLVGYTLHALVPSIPLAMCFALGALVSPTDAVAVSAITERLRVPSRLTTILNGESLLNDATGLVAFKFALAALAAGGGFSVRAATGEFILLAAGGLALGVIIGWFVGRARDILGCWRGSDPHVEVSLSLMTPFAAYLAAESLGLSSVISIVGAGLYSGWRDPIKMDVETRRMAWSVWSMVLFWLNGIAFVLLGLQAPGVVGRAFEVVGAGRLAALVAIISAVAIAARLAWFFPGAYLPHWLFPSLRKTESPPDWRAVLVGGWAGMRGAVTLAAALSIPLVLPNGDPTPARDLIIALSFGVILVTLFLQGTTLAWLIRVLGVRTDDTAAQEDRAARIAAIEAGLLALRACEPEVNNEHERAALGVVLAEYEQRLAELGRAGETTQEAARRRSAGHRYRLAALHAERRALDKLWREQRIDDIVHRPLQTLLDHEESLLLGRRGARAD